MVTVGIEGDIVKIVIIKENNIDFLQLACVLVAGHFAAAPSHEALACCKARVFYPSNLYLSFFYDTNMRFVSL